MAKMRPLLDRLLATPDLAAVVPRLQPDVLHRVIQSGGLEDCAELVALATPAQLARVLDADVWHARAPGLQERFDADRFGVWLDVLMESGAPTAAAKLMALDLALVVAGVARHAAVFDSAAVAPYTTLDGEEVRGREPNGERVTEIGAFVIEAIRTSAWDTIVELLVFLDAEHPDYFARLMRRCVRLSNGAREADGFHSVLDDEDQHMFDLAASRESRRQEQGFVTPEEARAFLHGARNVRTDAGRAPRNALAHAYFRGIEPTAAPEGNEVNSSGSVAAFSSEPGAGFTSAVEVLREAGVLHTPVALLDDPRTTSHLVFVKAHVASKPDSAAELAYLANALASGCSLQGRAFTGTEASAAAAAVCNLGLERWPPHWSDPDLVTAFEVGWTILYREACVYAAQRLIDALEAMHCSDRDIQLRLDGLRRALTAGIRDREPWRARDSLEAILMLDPPCWAALLGLIDECPVVHAALGASKRGRRSINLTEFEFISENRQLDAVREFLASLPAALTL